MPATADKKLFSEIRDFELTDFQEEVISERTGKKVSTFSGIHQVAEIENNNGRVYPLALFETLLQDDVFREKVEKRRLVGQMGHPADGIVNPIDISHVTTEIKIMRDKKQEDGGVPIWAKSEILPTPAGEVLKTLFKAGVQIGTSSRGWGDSFEEGGVEVLDQHFDLGGFDMVVEPSVAGAFPQPNIAESYQRLVTRVQERVDQFDPQPAEVTTEELEAYDAIIESIVCGSAQCDIDDEAVEALKSLRSRVQESLKQEIGVYGGSGPPDKKKKKKKKREVEEEPSPLATETGETKMPDAATISPELEQQLAAMSVTLTEQMEGLKQENESLRKQVEGASRINSELKSKLDAALEMIGRLTERLRGEGKRSDAAKKLAQASIEMSQDLNGQLSEEQGKVSAAEKLVTSSVKRANKVTNESLSEHVAGLIRRFPASQRKAVAASFDGVKSYQEANGRYRSIQTLVGGSKRSRTRDDEEVVGALKRKGSKRSVQESRDPRSLSTQTGDDIVNRTHALVNKMAERGDSVNG